MAQPVYLIDTNIVSEFVKKRPDENVMRWLQSVEYLAVSVVTIEEANYGLAWRPNSRKLALLRASIESMHAVYPVTESIAQRAGVLRGQFQAQGITRTTPDMLIAATAQEHQTILVTRNIDDFQGCGVQVLNPFVQ